MKNCWIDLARDFLMMAKDEADLRRRILLVLELLEQALDAAELEVVTLD